MNKKIVRLTESELNKIVKKSVNRTLKESVSKKRLKLKEGTSDSRVNEILESVFSNMSGEEVYQIIWNYLDSDMLANIAKWLEQDGYLEY